MNGDVPDSVKDKRLLVLDLAQLVAGAKYQGEFEERMKQVLKDVEAQESELFLFIDELHMLMSTGTAQGSLGAAEILKPALARGQLHCIGKFDLI